MLRAGGLGVSRPNPKQKKNRNMGVKGRSLLLGGINRRMPRPQVKRGQDRPLKDGAKKGKLPYRLGVIRGKKKDQTENRRHNREQESGCERVEERPAATNHPAKGKPAVGKERAAEMQAAPNRQAERVPM